MSPLAGPPPDLDGFPKILLPAGFVLHRIHRADHGPWWFSSGDKRFDLPSPGGTCYLAAQEPGAFVEVFQDWVGTNLPRSEVDARVVSVLGTPGAVSLADCTNPRALGFGVTSEIHSTVDRALTQHWAAALAEAGFQGIRYFVRHDPSQQHVAVALFGTAGEASWAFSPPKQIDDSLLRYVRNAFGIRING